MVGLLFVHAIGPRAGSDAWPGQAGVPGGRFVTRRGFDGGDLLREYTVDGEASWLVPGLTPATVLVGHSWSAVAALAAAVRAPAVRGVVLIEPMAAVAAPDDAVVREHVRAVSPAFEPDLSREEFRRRFSAGMGFDLPVPRTADDGRALELLRRHRPPWESTLTHESLHDLGVPLAVVTGAWSPLYETVGAALAESTGASHVRIEGAGHRPQDTRGFTDWLLDWAGALPPSEP